MPAAPPVITATLPSSRISDASIDDAIGGVKAATSGRDDHVLARDDEGRVGRDEVRLVGPHARVFGAGRGGAHGGGVVEPGDGDAVPGGPAPALISGAAYMALDIAPD